MGREEWFVRFANIHTNISIIGDICSSIEWQIESGPAAGRSVMNDSWYLYIHIAWDAHPGKNVQ